MEGKISCHDHNFSRYSFQRAKSSSIDSARRALKNTRSPAKIQKPSQIPNRRRERRARAGALLGHGASTAGPFPLSVPFLLPYGGSLRVGLPHPPKANAWQFGVLHECILAGLEDSLLRVVAVALVLPLERGPEERQSTAAELLGGHRRRGVLLNVDTVACLECRRPKGRASYVVGGFRRRGGAGCRGAASRGESSVVGTAVGEEG